MTDGLNQKGGKAAMCTAITLQTAQGEVFFFKNKAAYELHM